MAQMWEVVGGGDAGGIIVKTGEAFNSSKEAERLSTGALVEELELIGERLHFKRKTGKGPAEGWVSIQIPGKTLMAKADKAANGANGTNGKGAADDIPKELAVEPAPALAVKYESKRPWSPIPEEEWKKYPLYYDEGWQRIPKKMPEFKAVVGLADEPGDYWGIKFPSSPTMLKEMGPKWLTEAMHLTGALSKDNEVTRFTSMDVKAEDVTKQDAENAKWGGAGLKILLTVEYKNGPEETNTEGMFIKMPHEFTGKNERFKNSVGNGCSMDWSEVTFYNVFGGRFGDLPFKSPRMYFCDICRKTTNFCNAVERIPYAKSGTKDIAPGRYFPAPEKYRDWALPNSGVDLYYAHCKSLASFFAWHRNTMKLTDQVEQIFMDPGRRGTVFGVYDAVGKMGEYNSEARTKTMVEAMTKDPGMQAYVSGQGFPLSTASGFLEMGTEFISKTAPQAFPKELVSKSFMDKFVKQCKEMANYVPELNFWTGAIPEYFCLAHPNAQVDNAFYWRDETGEVCCGLLDWGGVNHANIPMVLGNGWMGAEPEVMEEHEESLVKLFVDEFEKACGFRFDCGDLRMCLKLCQCSVLFGCCANVGMLLRIMKKDQWGKVQGRMDPVIDENFLNRCYFVQILLWLRMFTLKNNPYLFFKQWMEKTGYPKKG